MSIYLTVDGNLGPQIATNRGWSDFGDWVDSLEVEEAPDLVSLWEHGISEAPAKVLDQLTQLHDASQFEVEGLELTVVGLIQILESLPAAEVIGISDGFAIE